MCLVLKLKSAAEDTGLELVLVAVGLVKSNAQYSSMTKLHQKGPFVVPVDTLLEDHRLVLTSHSTGGPVRRVMEQPCAIAGLTPDVPSDVRMLRAANQSLHALAHKVRSATTLTACSGCDKQLHAQHTHAWSRHSLAASLVAQSLAQAATYAKHASHILAVWSAFKALRTPVGHL